MFRRNIHDVSRYNCRINTNISDYSKLVEYIPQSYARSLKREIFNHRYNASEPKPPTPFLPIGKKKWLNQVISTNRKIYVNARLWLRPHSHYQNGLIKRDLAWWNSETENWKTEPSIVFKLSLTCNFTVLKLKSTDTLI